MSEADVDQVVSRLRKAAEAVRIAELPDRAWSAGLVLAYHDLAGAQNGDSSGNSTSWGDARERLAKRLQLEVGQVERLFDVDDEGVHLVVARADLSASKAQAMREVAQLMAAGRQGAGLEEWTDMDLVRAACDDRGVLDQSNFATEVRKLDGRGFRLRGERTRRQIKINQAGYESTGQLVLRLLGGGPP